MLIFGTVQNSHRDLRLEGNIAEYSTFWIKMANFMGLGLVVCFGKGWDFCMWLCWSVPGRGTGAEVLLFIFLNGKEERRWKLWI